MASLTCITWIYKFYRDSHKGSFVDYKLLQLKKAPACYHSIQMFVPCSRSLANCLELFHAYVVAIVSFGFFYELFRKNMVFVLNPASLFAGNFFKNSFRALCLFRLKARSCFRAFRLKYLPRFSGNLQAGRTCRNPLDPQIDPHLCSPFARSRLYIDYHVKIPNSFLAKNSCTRRLFPGESFPLKLTQLQGYLDSFIHSFQRDKVSFRLIVKNSRIEIDAFW